MLAQDFLRFLPFRDLAGYSVENSKADILAAGSVLFLSVPQGVAYALIAGLPPVMGLYAGALPAVFGSLFRSSRHVVTGPTNALSLLVGTVVTANIAHDPIAMAATLAVMIGTFQFLAGVLKLGALVDYISSAVVLGYVSGAGVLVGAGQLGNVTSTDMGAGNLLQRLSHWGSGLGDADPRTAAIAVATAAGILILRRKAPTVPGPIVLLGAAIAMSALIDLRAIGIPLVADIAPVPAGLPPFAIPSAEGLRMLLPIAIAGTVLSLVESSAAGRTIAGRTGQKLDASVEFAGQGIANVAAGLFGGYPVSGSLSRSVLNEKMGGQTRISGALTGIFTLVALLFLGPVIDMTPVASLAGLILVIAMDLIDIPQIRRVMRGHIGDRLAFIGTVFGTWFLSLDQAIYLGVGISLFLFLRRVRLVAVRDIVVSENNRLRELVPHLDQDSSHRSCAAIHAIHIEGSLFFGAANELANALDAIVAEPNLQVLVVRLKRARGLDYTTAQVLERTYRRMNEIGKTMLLVGMTPEMMDMLSRMGLIEAVADTDVYPTQPGWFDAMNDAMRYALEQTGSHECGDECPIAHYLQKRQAFFAEKND